MNDQSTQQQALDRLPRWTVLTADDDTTWLAVGRSWPADTWFWFRVGDAANDDTPIVRTSDEFGDINLYVLAVGTDGNPRPVHIDPATWSLVETLRDEQARRCSYGTREGDGDTCDCKFTNPLLPATREATGCPELRAAIRALLTTTAATGNLS